MSKSVDELLNEIMQVSIHGSYIQFRDKTKKALLQAKQEGRDEAYEEVAREVEAWHGDPHYFKSEIALAIRAKIGKGNTHGKVS